MRLIGLVLLVSVVLMCGCSLFKGKPVAGAPTVATQAQAALAKTIHSTDWLMTVLIAAIVCGVFLALQGMKVGWAIAVASLLGCVVKAAFSVPQMYIISAIVLIVTIVATVVFVLSKTKLLSLYKKGASEVVDNIETIKDKLKAEVNNGNKAMTATYVLDLIRTTLASQSAPTKLIVAEEKKILSDASSSSLSPQSTTLGG